MMGDYLLYILESGIVMLLLYITHKWLMATSTFHALNRGVLVGIIIISWLAPMLISAMTHESGNGIEIGLPIPLSVVYTPVDVPETSASWNWKEWLCVIYLAGCAAVTVCTLAGVFKMIRIINSGNRERTGKYTVVTTDLAPVPFSWGRYIVLRPADRDKYESMVMSHETAHHKMYHWCDLILVQVSIIFQWFNPATWLIRHELKSVHEYQADEKAGGTHPYEYQIMLIKKTVGSSFPTFADSLNQSQLKTRLTMMLKPKSPSSRRIAALAIPAMTFAAVFSLSIPSVAEVLSSVRAISLPTLTDNKVTKSGVSFQTDDNSPALTIHASSNELAGEVASISNGNISNSEAIKDESGKSAEMTVTFTDNEKGKKPAYFLNGNLYEGDLNSIQASDIESMKIDKSDPAYPDGKILIYTKGHTPAEQARVVADQIANFKGGQQAMLEFLKENIKWPEGVSTDKSARVVVSFIVGDDGSVVNPIVRFSQDEEFNAEALRVVKLMDGHWNPARTAEGEAVATQFTLPVSFKQQSGLKVINVSE